MSTPSPSMHQSTLSPRHHQSYSIDSAIRPIDNNRSRSQNIPLPMSHMQRTQSEVQLCVDMETAEQRDLNMFYRLVNGIRDRQMNLVRESESSAAAAAFYDPAHALTEAERSLAHIIHTRNAPVERKNNGAPAPAPAFTTSTTTTTPSSTSLRISTNGATAASARRNNYSNINNNSHNCNHQNRHTSLNSGVPILMHQQQQQRSDHENEWSVAGFDSSSHFSVESEAQYQHRQQQQQQQHHQATTINQHAASDAHGYASYGGATSAANAIAAPFAAAAATILPTLHSSLPSSSNIEDECMFDFEL